jgi:hypothetical protein
MYPPPHIGGKREMLMVPHVSSSSYWGEERDADGSACILLLILGGRERC